jgi:putative flavoprotein involved in K+ transport
VVVIGGGQAGLAVAYYLRRAGFAPSTGYTVLDADPEPGGAWRHVWDSLRLFSPSEYSSLPGWQMPPWTPGFPPARHVREYLSGYERRYDLPVVHGVRVLAVHRDGDGFALQTSAGTWRADAVISATGTWTRPFWPVYPGIGDFTGRHLHAADYRSAADFSGQRVVVVGGGNSGAQILAEVSTVADTTWVTARPPRFLSDEVDGRVLFQVATARRRAIEAGDTDAGGVAALGDIVMVPPVRDARERGVLVAHAPFTRINRRGVAWAEGREAAADAIIWCTGFRPALNHLAPLGLSRTGGHIATNGTASVDDPRIHLVGYGDWTGPASATLIGVGRTAREAVRQLGTALPPTARRAASMPGG